jgi:hypothetical protein
MTAGNADERQNNVPVYRSASVAHALAGAKKAVLSADSAYARFLAIRDGRADIERVGDDGSDAISNLSDFAISLGLNPDDVQKALALGLDLVLEERGHASRTNGNGFPGFLGFLATKVPSVVPSEWPEPDWEILDGRRGNLPEFPDDVFPPQMQAWLKRASHGAGVTTAHVAIPFLGIASSLIGIARCIHPTRSWPEPCSMWMGLVGVSGTGKTPGLDVTKRALSQIQKDRKGEIAKLQLAHETKVEAAKAASNTISGSE